MTVRREKTATGSAANRLDVESGGFLYDDGHSTSCRVADREDSRRPPVLGAEAVVTAQGVSYIRQEGGGGTWN